MKICPECELELPDGIPTCPDCDCPMVDPEEMPEDAESEAAENRYVFLRSVPSRLYANMLKEALRNEGIPAILQSEDVGIMLGNYGTAAFLPVRVLVPACYRNRALRIATRIAGDA
jgi:hypothetical protein